MLTLTERNAPVELPNRNPRGINPALMTFDEYYKLANERDKWHNSDAYDVDLKKLNQYLPKSSYSKLYRSIKVHGLTLEIWLYQDGDEWGIGVFNGDTKVAAVQDEWGALLVMVAREYRGFGLGPLLVKLARTIEPDRPSGGFTQAGYRNFIKVYQRMVRDALATGLYHRLVMQGVMSMERAKEIIASAKLTKQDIKPSRNLNSNDPQDWLLYADEYGTFILYDRKLKDLLGEDEADDYWIEQMIKGYAYVQLHEGHHDDWAMLRQFGGDTPVIKRFLISCAVEYTNTNEMPLWLEPDEINYINRKMIERVEGPSKARGFNSYKVIPTGETFNYTGMAASERRFRRAFDRYDEFKVRLQELAYGKYRIVPPKSAMHFRPWGH